MSKLVITRAKALALFVALGTTTADKWNNKRMAVKAAKVDELVDDDTKLPKAEDATLTKLLTAIENGVEIEVVDDAAVAALPAKKGGKATSEPEPEEAPKAKGKTKPPAPVEEDVEEVTFESLKAQYDAGEITAKEFTAARKKLPKVKPAPAKPVDFKAPKAEKPAKEPKPAKADAVPKTPGVRETVTRPYLAGVIIREVGLGLGITDAMIADLDKRYAAEGGRANPRESAFTLRNTWHAIRGYNDTK